MDDPTRSRSAPNGSTAPPPPYASFAPTLGSSSESSETTPLLGEPNLGGFYSPPRRTPSRHRAAASPRRTPSTAPDQPPPPPPPPPTPHRHAVWQWIRDAEACNYQYRRNLGQKKGCLYLCIVVCTLVVSGVLTGGSLLLNNLARCEDGSELLETRNLLSSTKASLATCATDKTILGKSVEQLKSANAVCDANNSHLQSTLSETKIELGALRTSYDICTVHEKDLESEVDEANRHVEHCEGEKGELKEELKKHLIVEWMDWVKELGTGGASWVCSDDIASWSFGLTSMSSPHTNLPINVWHRSFTSTAPESFRAGQGAVPATAQIVGYKVMSDVLNGNGWWRKRGLDVFGNGEVEFEAKGQMFYEGKYRAEVYYLAE